MFKWALAVFVVAILAGALGFSGLAPTAGRPAKVLFFLCLPVFVAFVVLGLLAGEALF